MQPYIVDLQEVTTDFYQNFKDSVIAQVHDGIKKEGKLKDKDKIKGKDPHSKLCSLAIPLIIFYRKFEAKSKALSTSPNVHEYEEG